jgi:hypothetical protein
MIKYILISLLLITGCSKTPEEAYSTWEISIYSTNGNLFEKHHIKSVDRPMIRPVGWGPSRLKVYTLNTRPEFNEPACVDTGINIPASWQMKIKKLNE